MHDVRHKNPHNYKHQESLHDCNVLQRSASSSASTASLLNEMEKNTIALLTIVAVHLRPPITRIEIIKAHRPTAIDDRCWRPINVEAFKTRRPVTAIELHRSRERQPRMCVSARSEARLSIHKTRRDMLDIYVETPVFIVNATKRRLRYFKIARFKIP